MAIPRTELQYRATRAGGPGGQHVNTSSTRIELLWDLNGSRAVRTRSASESDEARVTPRLGRNGARGGERPAEPATEPPSGGGTAGGTDPHALHVPKNAARRNRRRAAKERRLSEKKKRGERKREREGLRGRGGVGNIRCLGPERIHSLQGRIPTVHTSNNRFISRRRSQCRLTLPSD